uniref:Large ribosomal subunit protein uL10 n=1 Tax=Aotus nancymaae TaxID=37293 RepID=A0A2K5CGI0_AOTNA
QLLDDYLKCFIVGADNVGSKQMQQIRMTLHRQAVVLMGKNTVRLKAVRGHLENNSPPEKLLPHPGKCGLVFTKEDLTEIRDLLLANKVPAATHAGTIAPCEVTVPAQNTGLGPEKVSFLQALGISTKIFRGTIEILTDAFDNGSIYNPEVLDITEETLHSRFLESVHNVTSVCLQTDYPNVASVPHSIINGYKRVLALSVETDYTFPLAEKVKVFLADPSAFVAAATTPSPRCCCSPTKEELKEQDKDMGFGL